MKISAAFVCNRGKVRIENQDNLYYYGKILKMRHSKACSRFQRESFTKKAVCFGVFDGMGGEQYGAAASYLAAKTIKIKMKENKEKKIPKDILMEACLLANEKIYQRTRELKAKRIGATGAIVYIQYDRIWCCNVGDSRIYRLRGDELSQLSYDHIYKGTVSQNQKPGLTQHLGMNSEEMALFPYITDDVINQGDKFLICSDGLTDMVSFKEIENILLKCSSVRKCNRILLKRALENGGKDNITIITFKVK